jgi:hypothetical protein
MAAPENLPAPTVDGLVPNHSRDPFGGTIEVRDVPLPVDGKYSVID